MRNNIKKQKNNEIKNELDDLPPIEDLKISVPEVLCDPLGEVFMNPKLIYKYYININIYKFKII